MKLRVYTLMCVYMYELASLMFTQACKKGMCIFQKKTLIMRRGVRFKTHHDFISMSKYGLHSPDNRHMQSTTNPIAHTPSAQTLPTNRPTPPPHPIRLFSIAFSCGKQWPVSWPSIIWVAAG